MKIIIIMMCLFIMFSIGYLVGRVVEQRAMRGFYDRAVEEVVRRFEDAPPITLRVTASTNGSITIGEE